MHHISYALTLKIEAISLSKLLEPRCQTTQHYIPEDSNFHNLAFIMKTCTILNADLHPRIECNYLIFGTNDDTDLTAVSVFV